MKLHDRFCWTYATKLSATDCIDAILCTPLTFGTNQFNPQYYECAREGKNKLLITFNGPKYGKVLRTEYILMFTESSGICKVIAQFKQEYYGFIPRVSTYHLDLFMGQKIQARRID